MAEVLEESQGLESTTIGIYRTAATVKGGRRFSFSAMVVVGDRRGSVGLGYGKAPGVPAAIEKAQKAGRKAMKRITLEEGTLPHDINARYSSSSVRLIPASPGTGVIAGATVRAVLEMAGVTDCLSKAYGSTNQKNLAKAALLALTRLRSKQQIAELRGVDLGTSVVEEKLEAGRRYAPSAAPAEKPARPAPTGGKGKGKGGGKGRGRGGPRADSQRPARAEQADAPAQAPPSAEAPAPAPEAPADQPETRPDAPKGDES